MAVKFINKNTGGIMLVHETRVAEYEALGHTRVSAADPEKAAPAPEVKKTTRRKAKE